MRYVAFVVDQQMSAVGHVDVVLVPAEHGLAIGSQGACYRLSPRRWLDQHRDGSNSDHRYRRRGRHRFDCKGMGLAFDCGHVQAREPKENSGRAHDPGIEYLGGGVTRGEGIYSGIDWYHD